MSQVLRPYSGTGMMSCSEFHPMVRNAYYQAFVKPKVTPDVDVKFARPKPSKKTHKRCIKCRCWRPRVMYGEHSTSHDGTQSYCKFCKNNLGKKRRRENVAAKLRHHMSTRIVSQLGVLCPHNLTKDLDIHLGYTMHQLVRGLREVLQSREGPHRKLREALDEGYHVDHIRPLSLYNVIKEGAVDWPTFRECWAISNLRAIPADINLAKGAKFTESEGNPF